MSEAIHLRRPLKYPLPSPSLGASKCSDLLMERYISFHLGTLFDHITQINLHNNFEKGTSHTIITPPPHPPTHTHIL